MKIRNAKFSDAERCMLIATDESETPFTVQTFKDSTKNKNAIFLVLEENKIVQGYVIGFVSPVDPKECLLQETHVHIPQRNKGYATQLVNAFCTEANKRGVKVITAYVEDDTIGFYNKQGFTKSKTQWIEISKRL